MVKLGMVDYCFTHINDINVNFPVVSYLFGGICFLERLGQLKSYLLDIFEMDVHVFFFCSGVAILQIHLIMIEPHV